MTTLNNLCVTLRATDEHDAVFMQDDVVYVRNNQLTCFVCQVKDQSIEVINVMLCSKAVFEDVASAVSYINKSPCSVDGWTYKPY